MASTQTEILKTTRIIPDGKNQIVVRREDPYGFYKVSWKKGGNLPPHFKDASYTSVSDALKALRGYMEEKGIKESDIERESE